MKFTKAEKELISQINYAGELIIDTKWDLNLLAKAKTMISKNPELFYFEIRKSGLMYVSMA